jgi:stearoyl-CoA 9-desaturase NADPH oxidoreductase
MDLWTTPWLRPLNDVAAIDDLLAQLHPTWSLGHIKARVLDVVRETPDTKTFVLRPNRNWRGFRAGQHVGVEVEIDGVRHQRRYSCSSAPTARRHVAITVKRQPAGKVSSWLHDHVHVGDTVTLHPAAGSFVLPRPLPARMLMLSAGSGITPLMSMLRTLVAERAHLDVSFVHVASRRDEAIFAAELAVLAARVPRLRVHHHFSASAGRFDEAALARLVPDCDARAVLLCGPASFMAAFRPSFAGRLSEESFGVPTTAAAPDGGTDVEIRCARSERVFAASPDTPLLVAAEAAGLQPRYGCRMGICHTCRCVKRSGTVENVLTGARSSEPGEAIQLCISRAVSDVTLEL